MKLMQAVTVRNGCATERVLFLGPDEVATYEAAGLIVRRAVMSETEQAGLGKLFAVAAEGKVEDLLCMELSRIFQLGAFSEHMEGSYRFVLEPIFLQRRVHREFLRACSELMTALNGAMRNNPL